MLRKSSILIIPFLLAAISPGCKKTPVATNDRVLKVTATSSLNDRFGAANLTDGTWRPWIAGKSSGVGESFTVEFREPVRIETVYFRNGYGKGDDFAQKSRICRFEVSSPGRGSAYLVLTDVPAFQRVDLSHPLTGKSFTFTIGFVYKGYSNDPACLSEISFEPVEETAFLKSDDLSGEQNGGCFIAVGAGGSIKMSRDGERWVETDQAGSTYACITCGRGGCLAIGPYANIKLSRDGKTWNTVDVDPNGINQGKSFSLAGAACGNGIFVAVGSQGVIIKSNDGLTWFEDTVPGADLCGIAWGKGIFVAVGDKGRIITSSDGVHWDDASSGGRDFKCIVFGGNRFVSAGDRRIAVSDNGTSWDSITDKNGVVSPIGIAYGKGRYVTGGWAGNALELAVSTNGHDWTWTKHQDISEKQISSIAYGNGIFVAVGDNIILTSKDGLKWSERLYPHWPVLQGIAFRKEAWE